MSKKVCVKLEKMHISVKFLLKTFFGTFFKNFFNAFFLNFECKCARDGSKKRKNFFYKRVMEPSIG
jgi:hypothetical protein